MENLKIVKMDSRLILNILLEIRQTQKEFAQNCNSKREMESILGNSLQLRNCNQHHPGNESQLRTELAIMEGRFQQNILTLQKLMLDFKAAISKNLNSLPALLNELVATEIAVWKHQQQKMANGSKNIHSVTPKIQSNCKELAVLIKDHLEHLDEVERILKNGVLQTGNDSDLIFVKNSKAEVIKLIHELLNLSFVVEDQPPQIIKKGPKFHKPVVVSLLVGKSLNIQLNPLPKITASLISKEQARKLPVKEGEPIGEITDGEMSMEMHGDSERLRATFRSMKLTKIERGEKKDAALNKRVMEEKCFLYFACKVTVDQFTFEISTISLPVVVTSHGSQEALGMATILWDNATAELGRTLFSVPEVAPWSEIEKLLNEKFTNVAGGPLTKDNLSYLARVAFGDTQPHPETISWSALTKDNLPGRAFTFWTWFHAILKLMEKTETHLKELWKANLVIGFIDRSTAEKLLSSCQLGTFLIRFSETIPESVSISVFANPGPRVHSINPNQCSDIPIKIREIQAIKYLFQTPKFCIPKDKAFGKFYKNYPTEGPIGSNGKKYVLLTSKLPDAEDYNVAESNGMMLAPSPMSASYCNQIDSLQGLPLPSMPTMYQEVFEPSPWYSNPPPQLLANSSFEMRNMNGLGYGTSSMPMDSNAMLTSTTTQMDTFSYQDQGNNSEAHLNFYSLDNHFVFDVPQSSTMNVHDAKASVETPVFEGFCKAIQYGTGGSEEDAMEQ